MPHCPTCKREFENEVTCPDDETPLVDELSFQTIEGPTSAWVEIASASNEEEALLLRGFLEAAGIPCQIESLKFHMEPVNLGSLGEIRLYVNAENEAEAINLLDQQEDKYDAMKSEEAILTEEGPAEIADDAQTVVEPTGSGEQ